MGQWHGFFKAQGVWSPLEAGDNLYFNCSKKRNSTTVLNSDHNSLLQIHANIGLALIQIGGS